MLVSGLYNQLSVSNISDLILPLRRSTIQHLYFVGFASLYVIFLPRYPFELN